MQELCRVNFFYYPTFQCEATTDAVLYNVIHCVLQEYLMLLFQPTTSADLHRL